MMQQPGIKILELFLRETGTYNAQYRRPYQTTVAPGTYGILEERLQGAQKFRPSMMAGIANQFVSPTAQYEKEIVIANGFNERRVQFIMKIEYVGRHGGGGTELVLGYTNYCGVSHTGALDPQMEFTVNSSLMLSSYNEPTAMGVQTRTRVTDCSHVLADNNYVPTLSSERDTLLCPQDVFITMTLNEAGGTTNAVVHDSRTVSTPIATKSRRSNGLATNYMSRIMQDYKSASSVGEFGAGEMAILESARGNASESLATADPFLSAIARIRNTSVGNVFRYVDLQMLDPNVENVRHTSFSLPTEPIHRTGQTAAWHGADRTTQVAAILSQSVPGLLMELGLTRIAFISSNLDFDAQIRTILSDLGSFNNGDMSFAAGIFVQRLEQEILKDVSYDNQVSMYIKMVVDLLGETWITVALNGEAAIDFVTPSFCDALTVPVLTGNQNAAVQLATDFNELIYNLAANNSPSFSGNNSPSFGSY